MNSLLLRGTTASDCKNHTQSGQKQVVRIVTDGLQTATEVYTMCGWGPVSFSNITEFGDVTF